ncbi:MAG: hypothetical protein U0324_15250 [Polyangiales bacterium]
MRHVGVTKVRWLVTFAALAACTANAGGGGGGVVSDVPAGGDVARLDGGDAARPDGGGADASDGAAPTDAVTPTDAVNPTDGVGPTDAAGPTDAGTDGPVGDAPVARCAEDVDTDNDRVTNAEECRIGTDPFNPDSDRDGALDGQEVRYPRACVSPRSSTQRRPPPRCTMDSDCMAGEACRGLDPRTADTDGDGVSDGLEDRNLDGIIDTAHGETDPRLTDSDGDGRGDGAAGLEICRPEGLATVTQLGLPGANVQAGFDPRWGTARRAMGTAGRAGIMMDDAAANISAGVFNSPSMGDTRAESARAEMLVQMGLGAGTGAVLVGRSFTTHEMNEAITSTYRVARATSASALRDGAAQSLLGMAVATGPAVVGTASEFLVDVTTVRRTMGRIGVGTTDVVVTVAPRAAYEDNAAPTSIRSIDLVNATATAELDKGLGAACQVFRATRPPSADFVWTVDTSGSMGPYQLRLGNTATAFFNRLRAAGVDFRVAVFNAGSAAPNLDTPGFRWIPGTDVNGARRLCEEVTSQGLGTCPTSTSDAVSPYAMPGDSETPTYAAVLLHDIFRRRAAMGETNPDRRFREGAQVITFHVTDEPGSNDWGRGFSTRPDPMTGMTWGASYAAGLPNIISYFRRNNVLTFGLVSNTGGAGALAAGATPVPCSMGREADLPRCVIEGNRGAYIPIATATDAEVSAAMTRIVEAIAGAASPFVLERTPITSTLQVRVRGRAVPRSRSAGFDYDAVSGSVVFYGEAYRPAMGDEVVVSYRVWQPCPSAGDQCVTDSDCCAPTVCRARRCQPPCRPLDAMCTTDADCCAPNACIMGACRPRPMCVASGGRCTPSEISNECCPPDICRGNGTCGQCAAPGETCTANADCCGGSPCMAGRCACRPTAGRCTSPSDCCSRYCIEGLCGPG